MMGRKGKVQIIGISPKTRKEPWARWMSVNEHGGVQLPGGGLVPLDGKLAFAGPTFIVDVDRMVPLNVSDEGEFLLIDGKVLEQYAQSISAQQINIVEGNFLAQLMKYVPLMVLCLLLMVAPVTWAALFGGV
jgi:hypothetical protein